MQQIAQVGSTPDEALRGSMLNSTDWIREQSGDPVISRVREQIKSGQKPYNTALANEGQEVKRYLKDWKKLKV